MKALGRVVFGVLMLAGLTFGASQAFAARAVLRTADCPDVGNWCATSRGGDLNCEECCNPMQSLCLFYDEDPAPPGIPSQGCICF